MKNFSACTWHIDQTEGGNRVKMISGNVMLIAATLFLLSCLCLSVGPGHGQPLDIGPGPMDAKFGDQTSYGSQDSIIVLDACDQFEETSTEKTLLNALHSCFRDSSCDETVNCVTSTIADLTTNLGCEEDEESGSNDDGGMSTCNQAAAAFILVETFRKFLEGSVKHSKAKETCTLRQSLNQLAQSCAPESEEFAQLYATADTSSEFDPKLAAGYDTLVRKISTELGRFGPIAEEIKTMHFRKLWHGAMTLALTFICPGLLAIISPAHLQLITVVQLLGMIAVFFYVLKIHGLVMALGAVSLSVLILLVQFTVVVLRTRAMMEEKKDQ